MSSKSRRPLSDRAYPGVTEPMAPALMRRGHEAAMSRLYARWAEAGFDDVRLSHSPVLGFPGPHKARPSEIAARTGRSRQHINILLNELEDAGYLVRVPDPEDNRGKVVMLTARGMDLMAAARTELEAIEADWERRLGKQRFAALKGSLSELGEDGTGGQSVLPGPDRKEPPRRVRAARAPA